jgi:hypothetical protein
MRLRSTEPVSGELIWGGAVTILTWLHGMEQVLLETSKLPLLRLEDYLNSH